MNLRNIAIFLLTLLGLVIFPSNSRAQSSLVEIGVADSVQSVVLGESRQIWIHLPNGFDADSGHKYPVIYLLDGEVLLGGLAMVQEYYNFFRLPEMIVVGISNQTNRTRDLTPSAVTSRRGAHMDDESGGAERFTRFIADELIPYIDNKFPTSSHRTLIGHSYAGLFTINTLIHHRDLFNNYIAIDPTLDWDDQKTLNEATQALQEEDFSNKGLFVSIANEIIRFSDELTVDNVMHDTTEFSLGIRSRLEFVHTAEAQKSNGLRFSWAFYPQDTHGSVPLASMRDGLVFLYDWWELKKPSLYNNPDTPTDVLISLVKQRSEALTKNLGYPTVMQEELLTMLGFMAHDMQKQPEKAQAVFELLVEYYPESAGAHSVIAEFYESQDMIQRAIKHAQAAYELSKAKEYLERVEKLKEKL